MAQTPEAKLTKKMKDAAHKRGAYAEKIHGSAFQTTGLPDLVLCYKGWFIGLEVKMPSREGTLTDAQRNALRNIKAAGGLAFMVTTVEQVMRILDHVDKKGASRS